MKLRAPLAAGAAALLRAASASFAGTNAVVAPGGNEHGVEGPERNAPAAALAEKTFAAGGGIYQVTIDSSQSLEMSAWADEKLAPVAQEWYPKIIKLLPSEGFEAPAKVSIVFRKGMGGTPAATDGNRISCNSAWFKDNLQGEAIGAVVHEMVHVVQQYGRMRHSNPDATRAPGWLTEGIADYIRWFKYEPQAHGADLIWMRPQRNLSLRYDASYRISANFLDWASEKYAKDLVRKLNVSLREGNYTKDQWKELTGHTVQELGEEWKKDLEEKLAAKEAGTQP